MTNTSEVSDVNYLLHTGQVAALRYHKAALWPEKLSKTPLIAVLLRGTTNRTQDFVRLYIISIRKRIARTKDCGPTVRSLLQASAPTMSQSQNSAPYPSKDPALTASIVNPISNFF